MRAFYDAVHICDMSDGELRYLAGYLDRIGERHESAEVSRFRSNVLRRAYVRQEDPEKVRAAVKAVAQVRETFTPELLEKVLTVMRGGWPGSVAADEVEVLKHVRNMRREASDVEAES